DGVVAIAARDGVSDAVRAPDLIGPGCGGHDQLSDLVQIPDDGAIGEFDWFEGVGVGGIEELADGEYVGGVGYEQAQVSARTAGGDFGGGHAGFELDGVGVAEGGVLVVDVVLAIALAESVGVVARAIVVITSAAVEIVITGAAVQGVIASLAIEDV